MRNLIAIVMVLGLAAFAFAQDLDSPTTGAPAQNAAPAGGNSVLDLVLAKMQQAEFDFMNGSHEGYWLAWGIGSTWDNITGFSSGWWLAGYAPNNSGVASAFADAENMLNQLSAAERAVANQAFMDSLQRVQAAGLN